MPKPSWLQITEDDDGNTVVLLHSSPTTVEEYPLQKGLKSLRKRLENIARQIRRHEAEADALNQEGEDVEEYIREALNNGLLDEEDLLKAGWRKKT